MMNHIVDGSHFFVYLIIAVECLRVLWFNGKTQTNFNKLVGPLQPQCFWLPFVVQTFQFQIFKCNQFAWSAYQLCCVFFRIGRTCKQLRALSLDESLWKQQCQTEFFVKEWVWLLQLQVLEFLTFWIQDLNVKMAVSMRQQKVLRVLWHQF